MKTLLLYLKDKCGYVATTMTRAEATVLGITYPLQPGWMKRFGNMEISPDLENALRELSSSSRTSRNKKARRMAGMSGSFKPGVMRLPNALVLSKAFYSTDEWKKVRYAALKKSDGRCTCCGRSRRDGKVMHVDHIKPKSLFPHLALDPSNLQVLCEDCNLGKSNYDITDWRH